MPTKSLESDPEFTLGPIPRETGEDRGLRGPLSGPKRSMKPAVIVASLLVVAIGATAVYFLGLGDESLAPKPAPAQPESTLAPQAQSESAVAHPVEKIATEATADADQAPLPALDDSDSVASWQQDRRRAVWQTPGSPQPISR